MLRKWPNFRVFRILDSPMEWVRCHKKVKMYIKNIQSLTQKSLERTKFKRYQKRLNAKVKPRVYGNPITTKKKLTKEERLRLAEKRDRQRPFVLAGLCLFFITVAIITPIAITFGIKSSKSVSENNSTFLNSSSVNA